MTKLVAMVQARMASTRLPGKVMRVLGEATVLRHTLERVSRTPGIAEVVCLTSVGSDCDVIEKEAATAGFPVFRGSEFDVLERHHLAAVQHTADAVMRVTSDCPLADPEVCGLVVARYLCGDVSLACNNQPASYPHGLDVEVFAADALAQAYRDATELTQREHVTPFIKENQDRFPLANVPRADGGDDSRHRWTLDTPEDWIFFKKLWNAYPGNPAEASWTEVLSFVSQNKQYQNLRSS